MSFKIKLVFTTTLILLSLTILANTDLRKKGTITGQIHLDTIWKSFAYLSYIEDFNSMYSMSTDMILDEARIDSSGKFSFNLKLLPKEDNLYRIHFVKKGDPPASIIIGGREENFFFLIANRYSSIEIRNSDKNNLIHNISFTGSTVNNIFQQIAKIDSYRDSSFYLGTPIKKEFFKSAIQEKYRSIADTCTDPLLSLFSVYKSNFEYNYFLNRQYYNEFSKKWKSNNSTYFKAFREQLPENKNNESLLRFLIALVFLLIGYFAAKKRISFKSKTPHLNNLSVQERKIFYLIQQGKSNQEISDDCNIGVSTVKSHVSNIYSKLKIGSRKEALNIRVKESSLEN